MVVRTIKELQDSLISKRKKMRIGFVPTMGDLHAGHLSLIQRSKRENQLTVVSIFVNPKQFNNKDDYQNYHRDEKGDIKKAQKEKVDLLFIPSESELYPNHFQTSVTIGDLSKNLCGAYRPGHFQGVATVVLKLLNLVQPNRAYLGMKDFQQYKIIEQMVKDLNLSVKIIPSATIREKDGLALSSRNRRLSPSERVRASFIFSALQSGAVLVKTKKNLTKKYLFSQIQNRLKLEKNDRVEYLQTVHPNTLLPLKVIRPPLLIATAIWIGKTRLIDNLLIEK